MCYDNNMMAVLVSERGTTTYRLLANMFGLWPSTITVRGNRCVTFDTSLGILFEHEL